MWFPPLVTLLVNLKFVCFLLEPKIFNFKGSLKNYIVLHKYLFVFMFVCQYLYVQLYLTQFNKPSNKPPARQAKPKVSFVCLQLHVCLFPMSVSLWFLIFCECLY